MTPSIIQLIEFQVFRNGNAITHPLTVDFRRGEITVFMGLSGVGKTSVLLGLLGYSGDGLTSSGRRLHHEREIPQGSVLPGKNVYIPQSVPFNPNWEVGSFLCRLPWGNRKWWHEFWPETPARRKQVMTVLRRLSLASRLRATVAELSGGEIQRAALAQLLLIQPEFFVADEMTTGLDPGITEWVLEQCRIIVDDCSGAAAMATHNVVSALKVGNQIVLIWPAMIGEPPWVLNSQSPYWDRDALSALLSLTRWFQEFADCRSTSLLVSQLRRLSLDYANVPEVQVIKPDGKVESPKLADCSRELRETLKSRRCIPIRHVESDRLLIGLAGLGNDATSGRAILAEIRKNPRE